jgi:hypothetical protein
MRYLVARELGVANLMSRRFDWSSNTLWYEEIPNARDASKTLFLFGGNDEFINAPVCLWSHLPITYLSTLGMAQLPLEGPDEESDEHIRPSSLEESFVQLEYNDPRAMDFRFSLRA